MYWYNVYLYMDVANLNFKLPASINKQHLCNTRLTSVSIERNSKQCFKARSLPSNENDQLFTQFNKCLTKFNKCSVVLIVCQSVILIIYLIMLSCYIIVFYMLENIPFSINEQENKHGLLLYSFCLQLRHYQVPLHSIHENICRTISVLLGTLLTKKACIILQLQKCLEYCRNNISTGSNVTVSKCPATKSFESEEIFAEVGSKAKVLLCRKKVSLYPSDIFLLSQTRWLEI